MDVKKVREDVNLKLQELCDDMVREVTVVHNDYATLHKKVDIICDAVTKYVTLCESLSPQISQLSTTINQKFGEAISMIKDSKDSVLKSATSLIITHEFLLQKFTQFEAIIHRQLAPLSTISNLLPTSAPPVRTGVQGGEKRVGEGSHAKDGGDALHGEAKLWVKFIIQSFHRLSLEFRVLD
ncbi:unnamed protein product [Lactuca saligna]|uniref:Uncharacterized protein n=1 Tax=Lactuca saligna TaxID=75948 RepID=A0AA35YMX0_LACSI|nr:unnamed protein product [Lactuca saligna]